jgi:hypothetical protein
VIAWREYQEQVASLFREQGFSAEVEFPVKGARGIHVIDVWVQFRMFGFDHKWAVESKHWKSPVPKEKVMALKSIVEDIGADKGIMVAESGFQAGAWSATTLTNIWLTTLNELRSRTMYDLQKILLDDLERDAIYLLVYMGEFWEKIDHPTEQSIFLPRPDMDDQEIRRTESYIHEIERGFRQVKIRDFPVTISLDNDKTAVAHDEAEFIKVVRTIIDDVRERIGDHRDYLCEVTDQAHREEYEREQRAIEEERREKKAQS